jgi:hypothetical protein
MTPRNPKWLLAIDIARFLSSVRCHGRTATTPTSLSHTPTEELGWTLTVQGVSVPDSKLAREITELVRDTESPMLFHHSSQVYYFGALAGKHRDLRFDPELLYAGAMFHDMGLTPKHSSAHERFEVDSANTARDFLRSHGISEADVYTVWTAIALHTTPNIPPLVHPVVALVTAGVEMDVLGIAYSDYADTERNAVVQAHPRNGHFKEDIVRVRASASWI